MARAPLDPDPTRPTADGFDVLLDAKALDASQPAATTGTFGENGRRACSGSGRRGRWRRGPEGNRDGCKEWKNRLSWRYVGGAAVREGGLRHVVQRCRGGEKDERATGDQPGVAALRGSMLGSCSGREALGGWW